MGVVGAGTIESLSGRRRVAHPHHALEQERITERLSNIKHEGRCPPPSFVEVPRKESIPTLPSVKSRSYRKAIPIQKHKEKPLCPAPRPIVTVPIDVKMDIWQAFDEAMNDFIMADSMPFMKYVEDRLKNRGFVCHINHGDDIVLIAKRDGISAALLLSRYTTIPNVLIKRLSGTNAEYLGFVVLSLNPGKVKRDNTDLIRRIVTARGARGRSMNLFILGHGVTHIDL